MIPAQHAAYVAFMEVWDAPIDVSNGSRQGMDDHEMAVVYAAQRFVADDPPPEVHDAMVEWLRTQASLGGAWNYGGQALRIICETEQHPRVLEMRGLIDASRDDILAFLDGCRREPIEVLDAILSVGWMQEPGGMDSTTWRAAVASLLG